MLRFYSGIKRLSSARILFLAAAIIILFSNCTRVDENVLPEPSDGSAIVKIDISDNRIDSGTVSEDIDYFKGSLSAAESLAYDRIVQAVMEQEPMVLLPEVMTPNEITRLFTLVYMEESKVFWLSNLLSKSSEATDIMNLSYRYSKETTDIMKGELELAVGNILGELPPECSALDAVCFFHDTIVTSCTFSEEKDYVNSAYGALVDGFAQCEGYAYAMSLLCDRVGIENLVVRGYNSKGETHAWNKVYIDGEWYNVDCTWDDPILKYENPLFLKHDYLLVKDEDILNITHFIEMSYFAPPPCMSDNNNYFYAKNLIFDSADAGIENLKEQIKKQAVFKRREVEIKLSTKGAYNDTVLRLFENNEINDIIENINAYNGAGIKSAYKYNNDDLKIIHLSLIYNKD